MVKEQFAAARKLIDKKQYSAARAVLEEIDHPATATWLERLNKIEAATKAKRPPRALVALAILAIGAIVVFGSALFIASRQQAEENQSKAQAAVSVFCAIYKLPSVQCQKAFAEGKASADDVLFCDSLYNDDLNDPRGFVDCLSHRGLYLPVR